ncbi:zinc transporter ZupT [Botrimarina colliarenosi]|uniref:Zinc transporter ZupT n=1 Tax=Botrimarina colliarenosi TaxID=2528001 RepID=A0A5C6AEW0_9BACT|nr:ZIP family metal transporter [Botrimarina colliarenosi]TWT97947.1 zinc transporter ZupT [Botrimarina colliarenosi]
MHTVLLAYYCAAIVAASVAGGLLPRWLRLSHRRTEMIVSFVAGTMLGVALLHLLPHALASSEPSPAATLGVFRWTIGGFLAMFFIERFFCFHHHEADEDPEAHTACGHDHSHSEHLPKLSWSGATMGLTLHTLLAGVALAASVRHSPDGVWLPGLGTFVAIVLHKPLDAMTIAVLMGQGRWSTAWQALVNGLFALAVPAGVLLYLVGFAPMGEAGPSAGVAAGVAFSAGVFLCVAMSDLLPELQFHDHDRLALSGALLAGLVVAEVARQLETHTHAAPPNGAMTQPADPQESADPVPAGIAVPTG